MKTFIKLATAFLVAIVVFGSCTSQKELMYLSNLDTTAQQQFFPMEKPDYQIQYQDILYIDITTMNEEMNAILNPNSGSGYANIYRGESNIYVFGYTVNDSGMVSLPILGDVFVYGFTLNEIQREI